MHAGLVGKPEETNLRGSRPRYGTDITTDLKNDGKVRIGFIWFRVVASGEVQ
jgi:hypothetical protein